MSTFSNRLGDLIILPEEERGRLAFALLDSIRGLDPHAGVSQDEFRREIHRRADAAFESPEDSMEWGEAEALIRQNAPRR